MYTEHEKIRQLLEETIRHLEKSDKKNFRDKQIFDVALGDTPGTGEIFLNFLHDVSTCPPEVIQWCRRQINVHLSVAK